MKYANRLMRTVTLCFLVCLLVAGCAKQPGPADSESELSSAAADVETAPETSSAEAEPFAGIPDDKVISDAVTAFLALNSWSFRYDTQLEFAYDGYEWFYPKYRLKTEGELIWLPETVIHGIYTYNLHLAPDPIECYLRQSDAEVEGRLLEARYYRSPRTGEFGWVYGPRDKQPEFQTPPLSMPSARWGYGYGSAYYASDIMLAVVDNIGRALTAGEGYARQKTGEQNGRAAVCFEGKVSGENLVYLLENYCIQGEFCLDEDDQPIRDGVAIRIWIDAERCLPLRFELDFTDLMQQELALEKNRENTIAAVLSKPGLSDIDPTEMLAQWDDRFSFDIAIVTIDLTPEPCEITIPEDVAKEMQNIS